MFLYGFLGCKADVLDVMNVKSHQIDAVAFCCLAYKSEMRLGLCDLNRL